MRAICRGCHPAAILLSVVLFASAACAQNWVLRNMTSSPSARAAHGMAFDSVRKRVVLFGGTNGASLLADTHEWDGTVWIPRSGTTTPLPRSHMAMTYDAARRCTVLFAGIVAAAPHPWEWDGKTWTWRVTVNNVGRRYVPAMAYDSARKRTVMYGGQVNPNTWPTSTWEWDGTSWNLRSSSINPGGRVGHAMAYDAARRRTVLIGGEIGTSTVFGTWEWDGMQWLVVPTGPGSNLCSGHALAYDSHRQRVMLFGSQWVLNDTWEWDGTTWNRHYPLTSPPPRTYHGMAFDDARGRLVVFGGSDGKSVLGDTWEYVYPSVAQSGTGRVGTAVQLTITAVGESGLRYQIGSSLGSGPIMIGWRRLGLSPDNLLAVSASGAWPTIFSGYDGVLDGNDQASAAIRVPNLLTLVGTRIHTAFVTLDSRAPCGIRSISPPASFTVIR